MHIAIPSYLGCVMLARIKIKNFKCIKEVTLDLAPLTIIFGPNGSGKSSILQAIQLLKQSAGKNIRLDGDIIRFASFRDIVLNRDEDLWITLEVSVQLREREIRQLQRVKHFPGKPKQVSKEDEFSYRLSFRGSEVKQSLLINAKPFFEVCFLKTSPTSYVSKIVLPKIVSRAHPVDATQILLPRAFTPSGHPQVNIEVVERISKYAGALVNFVRKRIELSYYISASRNVNLEVAGDGFHPTWVGIFGQNTISLLALIFGSREYDSIKQSICKWADHFGLPELVAGWTGGRQLSADFKDPKLRIPIKVTAAGHGSMQMLPIITQLFWSPEGSMVSFEEPEISLHLELQGELPKMFTEVINKEKQIIVTTQSQNILFTLKPLIAKKAISHEKVAIYELEKSAEGSTAKKLPLTPEGIVKGGIPSFVEAERYIVYQWMMTIPPLEGEIG